MLILDGYHSLDLQISKGPEGSFSLYTASILENGNVAATHNFELRQNLKLQQMLNQIEEKATVPKPQPVETVHKEFGKILYDTVFSDELGDYFKRRFNEALDENYGLRISLRFGEDTPEIAALPWEYLHNGEDFLITKRSFLLSRLPVGQKKTESKPLDSTLRMLVVISSPDDPRISPLNTEREQEIILEALDKLQKKQKIKVDFTEDATFENVQGYLNEQNYHIVHFTGHGISINGKGHLVFETEDRKVRLIDNRILADLFSDMGIRLVVLSSCESAKGSNKEAFGDLASMLSKKRIPSVVAMQYSLLDEVAIKFAHTFYRTIAQGKSVDVALNETRIMMKDSDKSNGFDFATPILYLSDCNCVQVKNIKPEPAEFVFKPMMLPDLQVMKKGFVARKKELRILEKGFKSDVKRAAIIHGFGGMGKTVLATRLALKMGEYFDGIFGMRCTSTTRPEDILNKINNFLMMKGIFNLNQILNQQVPLEVKTSLLVNILNQSRFLIILDNFEDCLDEDRKQIENPELKAFVQHFLNNTITNTKFIITTRYDFDPLDGRLPESIEHISLPELHFPQTNWLMNNYTELADLDIRKKRQIYDVIGGHPWIIGQFAKIASSQGVDSLMLDLKSLKKELIEFTLLDKSFSKLDASAKKLLLCASAYEEAIPIEALSWIVGDNQEASPSIGEPLKKLIQWGLISKEQEYDQTVYMEHTIVKDFSHEKLEEEGLDKKKLLIRAARYYESLVSQNRNIWDHLKARDYYFKAEDWENVHKIVESTSEYLIRWGHIELVMNLLNESINTTSGITRINIEYTLATIYQRLGDMNSALKIYNEIKLTFEENGNYKGVATVLHALGNIDQDQGKYEEAVKKYNQSLKIKVKMGEKNGTIYTLHALGNVYYSQGNYNEAVKKYNHSLEIAEELGNKIEIAATLHELGNIHYSQGEFEEAVSKYNRSLRIAEELGNKSGIATTLHALGNIYFSQGKLDEAAIRYNQSLKFAEELGEKNGIAATLHQLGMIHQKQGNLEEAAKNYNQSLKIGEETEDKEGIASTLYQLGVIYQMQGYLEDAVEKYNQSLKIAEEIGSKIGITSILHQFGMINQDQGNYEEAIKKYNQSLKINEELGNRSGIAITLGQLGRIYEDKEEYSSALSNYLISISMFEQINSPNKEIVKKFLSTLREKMGEEEFNTQIEMLAKSDDS